MPYFTVHLNFLLLYSANLFYRWIIWSNVNRISSSKFWLEISWSIYWIIYPVLSYTTFITGCTMLNLPPGITNISRHVVVYFPPTTITMVESIAWQLSWYNDEFLYVLFLWDSVAIEIEFRTMIFCLCHSGISLLAIHIQPCVNTIVLFICGECCLFVCSNHVILYCSINTEIFSFFSIIFYLIP